VQQWYRLQEVLYPWYEQIQEEALAAAVLHADETGWRVNGKRHWLWCFTTPISTYYLIDQQRGRPVLARFFRREFAGVLVSDFWGAYNAVVCGARQTCLPHLLRNLEHVEKYKHPSRQWPKFAKRLRRHRNDLLTFLDHPAVPYDNNHGERAIRPAVIIRKNSYCNRSQRGADTQAVLMSIYRTLKQRGHDPLETISNALTTYLTTKQLPRLPT